MENCYVVCWQLLLFGAHRIASEAKPRHSLVSWEVLEPCLLDGSPSCERVIFAVYAYRACFLRKEWAARWHKVREGPHLLIAVKRLPVSFLGEALFHHVIVPGGECYPVVQDGLQGLLHVV